MTSFGEDVQQHVQVKRFFTWPMPNGHAAANGSDQSDLLTSCSCKFLLFVVGGAGGTFRVSGSTMYIDLDIDSSRGKSYQAPVSFFLRKK